MAEESGATVERLNLVGGDPALDFLNTVGWHATDHPTERLHGYADVVRWGELAGLLGAGEAGAMRADAAEAPGEAAAAHRRALEVREALYRIFSALAADRPVDGADLALLNGMLPRALGSLRLAAVGDGFGWDWDAARAGLDLVLWKVVRAAADLLTSAELARVRECADDGCGWVFLDTSRNRSRRWCDMRDCGNRAKARRHYRRRRASGNAAE